jgi:hypothetical protein
MSDEDINTPPLADDLLRGCAAISAFVGLNERQGFHALQHGHLPATKEGRIWISSKSRLRQHYNNNRYEPKRLHSADAD